ncbi:MAG: DNA-binding response regulator [Bacteroidetes bacterium MED-G17]|nr:MAG: DNA-binding response regulator [Bacteroidetes bacterium TMED39]PDH51348.1 MAG: DNA-binding response regulator [Bacteroidetes bacterium MED-G17]
MPAKILIVDDEPDIVEFIQYNLEREGFDTETAYNGEEAIAKARSVRPDIIILDVMMPVMDGIEACRIIKEDERIKNTFVVFLTARSEEYSELAGFEVGADDYISKPIKPRVLVSRLKAMLKRGSENGDIGNVLTVQDLIINRNSFNVQVDDKTITMPKKEFDLLFLLASKPGKVFTREKILSEVWGDDVLVVDRTIDVHIRKIREKLGDKRITTVKGVGYKLEK